MEGEDGRSPNLPSGTTIVDEHVQTIGTLFDVCDKLVTARFVLQIRNDILALSWAELVEALACFLQLGLLARRDDDPGAVLDEGLGSHLAETSGATSHEAGVRVEGKEGGDTEVFCVWCDGHGDVVSPRWGLADYCLKDFSRTSVKSYV